MTYDQITDAFIPMTYDRLQMLTAQGPQGLTVWSSPWTQHCARHAACPREKGWQGLPAAWLLKASLSVTPGNSRYAGPSFLLLLGLEPLATSLWIPKASTACC